MNNYELTSEQWETIRQLLPPESDPPRGRPSRDARTVLGGVLYWLQNGISWRELPPRYGPWQSIYGRFRLWKKQGIWRKVFHALILQGVLDESVVLFQPPVKKTAGRKTKRAASGKAENP